MNDAGRTAGSVFTPFQIDGARVEPGSLRICGKQGDCRIEPKTMMLLVALSERPGQLWTREELLARLWAGAAASDECLTRIVYLLRKALKQVGATGASIRTMAKLGYQLEAEVREVDAGARSTDPRHPGFPPFSAAVLPVVDQSANGDAQFLADGLTRDLTMLLARTPRLRVTPYSSAVHLAAEAHNATEAGTALHARFIVTASLARCGDLVRIRVELCDADDDVLLWAEKFEAAIDRFFDVQEDAVCSITTAISAKVNTTQPARVRRSGRFEISAYERVQAAEALRFNYGPDSARQIVTLLQEALAIEPHDPITRAALAVQLSQNVVSQWAEDPAATMAQADALISRALTNAPNDPDVRAAAGVVATMLHRPDVAIGHLEFATQHNPNDAHALAVLGWQRCLRHADSTGIDLIETAEQRAPHHPRFGLWATYRATGHLFMLDYANALPAARQAIERTPNYYQPHLTCAWACTGLDDSVTANCEIRIARELELPDILGKFVDEMHKWSMNSPNHAQCREVLERLRGLATA